MLVSADRDLYMRCLGVTEAEHTSGKYFFKFCKYRMFRQYKGIKDKKTLAKTIMKYHNRWVDVYSLNLNIWYLIILYLHNKNDQRSIPWQFQRVLIFFQHAAAFLFAAREPASIARDNEWFLKRSISDLFLSFYSFTISFFVGVVERSWSHSYS